MRMTNNIKKIPNNVKMFSYQELKMEILGWKWDISTLETTTIRLKSSRKYKKVQM